MSHYFLPSSFKKYSVLSIHTQNLLYNPRYDTNHEVIFYRLRVFFVWLF